MKDFVRRGRSNSTGGHVLSSSAASTHSSSTRSILPSVKLRSIRRQADPGPPANDKQPLLTLTLSSPSFLDSSVKDIYSAEPLYQIKTIGTSTTVSRKDPVQPSVTAASIKWPRHLPLRTKGKGYSDGVLLQMKGGHWSGGETVLKPGASATASRKFNIPNYAQVMKWKQYGKNTYWCTTPSVKGPIATLKMAKGQIPTILTVYETLHDKQDPRGLQAFKGVSILLLDYLLVTALLLVTDLQDWMLVRKFEDSEEANSRPSESIGQGPSSASDLPAASAPQLRKIMFGEPIFPKLGSDSLARLSDVSLSPTMSPVTPGLPRTPTSPPVSGQTYSYLGSEEGSSSQPSHDNRKTRSAAFSGIEFDSESEDEFDDTTSMRPPSASAESMHFTSSSYAPAHNYTDSSFYGSQSSLPPVPPIPLQYTKALGRNFSSQPSTPVSASFKPLPPPPPVPSHLQFIPTAPSQPSSSSPVEFANPHRNEYDSEDDGLPPPNRPSTIDSLPPPPRPPTELLPRAASSSPTPHPSPLAYRHLSHEVAFRSSSPSTRSDSVRSDSVRSSTSYSSSRPGSSSRNRRPLPRPPPVPPIDSNTPPSMPVPVPIPVSPLMPMRRVQSSNHLRASTTSLASNPSSPMSKGRLQTPPRPQRSLPPTPLEHHRANTAPISPLATEFVYGPDSNANSTSTRHQSPQPITTKASHSQEDLTEWVDKLTNHQRHRHQQEPDEPPPPLLPRESMYDVPPPAYSSLNFSSRSQAERPPVPIVNVPYQAGASIAAGNLGGR